MQMNTKCHAEDQGKYCRFKRADGACIGKIIAQKFEEICKICGGLGSLKNQFGKCSILYIVYMIASLHCGLCSELGKIDEKIPNCQLRTSGTQ